MLFLMLKCGLKSLIFNLDQPMRSHNVLILHMLIGRSSKVSSFIGIRVNRLCISIVFVLYKTFTKNMKYLYLPTCHVIINQHQINSEHANVILN